MRHWPGAAGASGPLPGPTGSAQQHAAHDHLKDRLDQWEHLCHAGAFRRQPRGKLLRLPQQGAEPSPAQFHGGQQTVLMGAAQGVRRRSRLGKPPRSGWSYSASRAERTAAAV